MSHAIALAPRLTIARLKARQGDGWLDLLSVLAFALSSLMAFTVAGGIWMFYHWNSDPSAEMVARVASALVGNIGPEDYVIPDAEIAAPLLETYLALAIAAGFILIIPIFSLGSSAARLGARGRAARLASLRLMGVTSNEVVLISVIESIAQWVIGTAIGVIAYFATLPLWGNVHFLLEAIDPREMVVPWQLFLLLLLALAAISLLSTANGLRLVRISPLGVTRREPPKALKFWRVIVFFVMIAAFIVYLFVAPQTGEIDRPRYYAGIGMFVMFILGTMAVVGPFTVQVLAAISVRTRHASKLLAMRRILDDPRAAWRTVNALALMCFISCFLSVTPMYSDEKNSFIFSDIYVGANITMGFAFAVAALSTLMNQASSIFDSSDQTVALTMVGFPRRVFSFARSIQVLAPMFLACVVPSILGAALGSVSNVAAERGMIENVIIVGLSRSIILISIGIALSVIALIACEPLERMVIARKGRAND